ncbi:autotransporter domain protein [Campylobacter pinnipediorum subsp. pinnipediorum]|uniref:autotransporter outer membrane beta-barrel domain-containing protein n=1 Tax=Campylobacter pinnipediorum TaxID=1965231 RepID=UPI0009C1FC3C|nr:autotransporter outer membrane beta-barrel domain-containing protein [Campylobacter pinnipediorum]AQW85218.1 autotransporter domain protein [Campylobacter pinnipediorum subsp. pinnipediorum]
MKKKQLEVVKNEAEKLKQQALEQLDQANRVKQEAEQIKNEANRSKQEAEQVKQQAETAKAKAEQVKQQAQKDQEKAKQVKIAAEQARNEAQKEKKQAETKAFENGKTKETLNKIIETDNVLGSIFQGLDGSKFKGSSNELTEAIGVFQDNKYTEEKLSKLVNTDKIIQIIEIIEKLSKIGLVKEQQFSKLKAEQGQELTQWLNDIIGNDPDKGLRKLLGDARDDAATIKTELEAIITAKDKITKQQEIETKQQEIETKQQEIIVEKQTEIEKEQRLAQAKEVEAQAAEAELQKQKQEIATQDQKITEQTKTIETQQKIITEKEAEITQQTEKITQQEQSLQQAQEKLEQAEQELQQAEELAKAAKDPKERAKALAELESKIEEAKKDRAKSISKDESLKFDKNEAQTVLSLLSVANNEQVNDLLLNVDAEDIATLAKNINNSLEEVAQEFKDNKTVDTLLSSVGSAINSRLAKLSNPLNDDLALAYAIKNLSDNKFADSGDTLSSVVKEYTNRFNYDSNLWGNIMGGKAKLKSQANTSTYGFMLGYDKAFDNMIIGGYAGYTNARSSSDALTTKSDNYHFGAYTRMYIEQNEIDAKVSYGKGKNKLDRKVTIDSDFDANGKYNSKFFNTSIDYGYIFDINNNSFMKPMIGLEYSHINTKGFKETGKVPVSFKGSTIKTLSAKAAVEFRKYIANGNFLYITPGIQRELSKSMKDTELAFVNSTENIKYASKKDKNTFFTLKTGAEMKLTDNLSTNVNFGVKAKSKQQHYNGTIGLSYKF